MVRLIPKQIEIPAHDPKKLETLVKLGFGSKRKMLRNNLQSVIARDNLTQLLEQLEINPQVRAEDLGIAQWVSLVNIIGNGEEFPS